MLLLGPFARNSLGLCGSVTRRLSSSVVAILAAPDLRPAEEEALVAGEAVDLRRGLAAERQLVGLERHRHAGQVADVLAERELAVQMAAVEHGVAGELLRQLAGALLELRAVVGRPPVAQVAVAVELPALSRRSRG